ncbi:MAG TPA: T9SS type A sorting domain-containing protein [Ferruginibacter sp.]|nr:T9SS type A sorting domain-containing protein [Ferruginibacter sp.]
MKTYAFLNFRSVILFFTFSLLVLSSKSQDPICSPILYSDGSLGITQTGPTGETANDVWEDDCVKLKVTINDNQTNSISWSFTDGCNSITNSGLEDLQSTSDVISPDVAIVVDYNNGSKEYYILIVYFDVALGEFRFDIWNIDSGSLQFVSSQTIYTPSNVPGENGIRIDANSIGDFVIVLEENDPAIYSPSPPNSTMRTLKTIAGQTENTFGPILSSNLSDLPNTYTYTQADVALSEDDFGSAKAYFTYLDVSKSILVVSWQDFSDILGGSITNINEIDKRDCTPITEEFGRPRIACSGDINFKEDWTIVWRLTNTVSSYQNILGLTCHDGDFYDHNYTNNSEEEFVYANISVPQSTNHENPNVSYGFYNGIGNVAQIAWQGSFTGSLPNGTGNYITALSLSLDEFGRVTYCSPATEPCFKLVPSGALNDDNRYPTLAGKHAYETNYMNVSWQNNNLSEVLEKDFLWCDNSFRQSIKPGNVRKKDKILETRNPQILIYPNPSNSSTTLSIKSIDNISLLSCVITDMSGKIFWSGKGNKFSIERDGSVILSRLKTGVYFIRITDGNNFYINSKIIRL